MTSESIKASCEDAMQKAVNHLRQEFKGVRTGRASTALVENIQFEYYGSKQPIKNAASISLGDATSILIKPFDRSQLNLISKAIMEANIGINPIDDGGQIRLNVPPMTEETRKKIASQVKDMAERSKVTVRNARQDHNKQADAALKDKSVNMTEDDHRALKDEIQNLTNKFNKIIEEAQKEKQEEVMKV